MSALPELKMLEVVTCDCFNPPLKETRAVTVVAGWHKEAFPVAEEGALQA